MCVVDLHEIGKGSFYIYSLAGTIQLQHEDILRQRNADLYVSSFLYPL